MYWDEHFTKASEVCFIQSDFRNLRDLADSMDRQNRATIGIGYVGGWHFVDGGGRILECLMKRAAIIA